MYQDNITSVYPPPGIITDQPEKTPHHKNYDLTKVSVNNLDLTALSLEQAIDDYIDEKISGPKIAKKWNAEPYRVYRIFDKLGIERRNAKNAARVRDGTERLSDEDENAIAQLIGEGHPIEEINRKLVLKESGQLRNADNPGIVRRIAKSKGAHIRTYSEYGEYLAYIKKDQWPAVVEMYCELKMSPTDIAKRFGLNSEKPVYRVLNKSGIPRNAEGRLAIRPGEGQGAVIFMHVFGLSVNLITKLFNLKSTTPVRNILRKNNIPTRNAAEQKAINYRQRELLTSLRNRAIMR